jgi:hypothetical protein
MRVCAGVLGALRRPRVCARPGCDDASTSARSTPCPQRGRQMSGSSKASSFSFEIK